MQVQVDNRNCGTTNQQAWSHSGLGGSTVPTSVLAPVSHSLCCHETQSCSLGGADHRHSFLPRTKPVP